MPDLDSQGEAERIAEIRARAAGATPLPAKLHVWRAMGESGLVGYDVRFQADPAGRCQCLGCMGQIDMAQFIVNAPSDIPYLLSLLATTTTTPPIGDPELPPEMIEHTCYQMEVPRDVESES